jgi:hypothetical protein
LTGSKIKIVAGCCELRERVQLAEEFGKLLSDFLEHRNALVHDLGRIHKDPFTTESRAVIEEYAHRTAVEARKVIEILTALMDAWTEQLGIRKAHIDDERSSGTSGPTH